MKLTNFVMIISGLMILFWMAGMNTSVGYVLGTLDLAENPTGFIGSDLYILILGIFAAAIVGGIFIGIFTKSPIENLLIAPTLAFFVLFLGDLMSIISTANASCGVGSSCRWVYYIVVAIIAPLAVVFLMTLIDWWRGRDS